MPHAQPPRPTATGRLRVALFAGLAEAAGTRALEVPWSGGSVGDLREAVAARAPAAAALLARTAVVVEGCHATDDVAIPIGADVALLPPVSGG